MHWWVSNIIPKKTKKFEFEKNFMAILFAVKNNPYTQILSIVGVSVGVLQRKQILKLENGKKSRVLEIFRKFFLECNQHHLDCVFRKFDDATMHHARDIANVLFLEHQRF